MGERGTVHTFHPTWTEPDPDNPGKRRSRTSERWGYRFEHNKRPYKKAGFKTQKEAAAAGRVRLAEVMAGQEEDPRKTTFEALRQIIEAEYSLKAPNSQRALKSALKPLEEYFGRFLAHEIGRPQVIEYIRWRKKSEGTAALELAFLRRAMRLALQQGKLLRVPVFPELKSGTRTVTIRDDELDQLRPHLPEHLVRAVEAQHEMGWRFTSEVLTRQWKHVEWGPVRWACDLCKNPLDGDECGACHTPRPGWVHMEEWEPKDRKARSFPMSTRLRGILTDQRGYVTRLENGERIIAWVFPDPQGRLQRERDVSDAWRMACSAAGLTDKRPHDLRRTAITRRAAHLSLAQGMAFSGHRSVATYMRYIRVEAQGLRQAAVQLERVRATERPKVTRIKKG